MRNKKRFLRLAAHLAQRFAPMLVTQTPYKSANSMQGGSVAIAKRSKRRGKKLSTKEQAEIKALSDLNHSTYAIEKRTGISHNTISKYLANAEAYSDPAMKDKVALIKEKEILDLTVLNVAAKARLHELAPRMNPIEAIALMDRSFQQLRLIEGKSTSNINTLTRIIEEAHDFTKPKSAPKDIEAEITSRG
jgi:uncharacterized protein YerC